MQIIYLIVASDAENAYGLHPKGQLRYETFPAHFFMDKKTRSTSGYVKMNFQAEKFEDGKVRARYPRGASARIIHESRLAHDMQQCSVARPVVASETLALKHNHVGL